jgi:hypothetical protein
MLYNNIIKLIIFFYRKYIEKIKENKMTIFFMINYIYNNNVPLSFRISKFGGCDIDDIDIKEYIIDKFEDINDFDIVILESSNRDLFNIYISSVNSPIYTNNFLITNKMVDDFNEMRDDEISRLNEDTDYVNEIFINLREQIENNDSIINNIRNDNSNKSYCIIM